LCEEWLAQVVREPRLAEEALQGLQAAASRRGLAPGSISSVYTALRSLLRSVRVAQPPKGDGGRFKLPMRLGLS